MNVETRTNSSGQYAQQNESMVHSIARPTGYFIGAVILASIGAQYLVQHVERDVVLAKQVSTLISEGNCQAALDKAASIYFINSRDKSNKEIVERCKDDISSIPATALERIIHPLVQKQAHDFLQNYISSEWEKEINNRLAQQSEKKNDSPQSLFKI